jgi:hypothetical protein
MPIWSRRPRLPPQVLEALGLTPGERVLASAATAGGAHVVATDRALFLPLRDGYRRVGWEEVDKAGWDDEQRLLWLVETAPLGSRPRQFGEHLEAPGSLIDVVRERVNAAVVVSQQVPVVGERGVRVVGRRTPGSDRLTWTVAVDPGVDVSRPEIHAAVEAAVAHVREQVGE